MVRIEGQVRFVPIIPRNGTKPVLHVGDHGKLGRVTFDLDGRRFRSQGFRLAVWGASGCGKSNTMALVAEEVHRIGYPFLVFDQQAEYVSLKVLEGVRVFSGRDYVPDIVGYVFAGGGAIVDVSELTFTQQRMIFAEVAHEFYHVAGKHRRRCFFFVDEASVVAPRRKVESAGESRQMMEHLVSRGRKLGIYTVAASQRLSALHMDVRAQFNVKLIGRMDTWQDLESVKPYLTRRIEMGEISGLRSGQFLLDLSGVSEVVQVRRRGTEDLGGTPEE